MMFIQVELLSLLDTLQKAQTFAQDVSRGVDIQGYFTKNPRIGTVDSSVSPRDSHNQVGWAGKWLPSVFAAPTVGSSDSWEGAADSRT